MEISKFYPKYLLKTIKKNVIIEVPDGIVDMKYFLIFAQLLRTLWYKAILSHCGLFYTILEPLQIVLVCRYSH